MKSSKEIVIVKQELFIGLNEEQIAKVKACKNQEEILKVAKEEGIELTDEQLEAVSGGCTDREGLICPHCGKSDYYQRLWGSTYDTYVCMGCHECFYYIKATGQTAKQY